MKITKENFTWHNIKRALKAYRRKLQLKLFNRNSPLYKFADKASLTEFLAAPTHIVEQFIFRQSRMSESPYGRLCLERKECFCGCTVPDLQLADDACEHDCYPAMMNEQEWDAYKKRKRIAIDTVNSKVLKYIEWN